jgi:hypothetical protein
MLTGQGVFLRTRHAQNAGLLIGITSFRSMRHALVIKNRKKER